MENTEFKDLTRLGWKAYVRSLAVDCGRTNARDIADNAKEQDNRCKLSHTAVHAAVYRDGWPTAQTAYFIGLGINGPETAAACRQAWAAAHFNHLNKSKEYAEEAARDADRAAERMAQIRKAKRARKRRRRESLHRHRLNAINRGERRPQWDDYAVWLAMLLAAAVVAEYIWSVVASSF
ncbi:hypothetical protein [Streptomyces collinus]|uniref:hypothetical protein n=1 Tax=Streptomyces collinus TaxID=42684 RepID=UPI003432BD8E